MSDDRPMLDYAAPGTPSEHVDRFADAPPTPGWQYILLVALAMFAIACGLAIGMFR